MSLPRRRRFRGWQRIRGCQHHRVVLTTTSLWTDWHPYRTNRSGGIQGGISNGEIVELKIAFKPTSTITQAQQTVNRGGVDVELKARGRHDPCVVPRAVPMVESMVALVLVDHLMMQFAQCNLLGRGDYSDLVQGNMKTLYDPQHIGGSGNTGRCPRRT